MEKRVNTIVDISAKEIVKRTSIASGMLILSEEGCAVAKNGRTKKGDLFEAMRISATLAIKETPRIIPHCHLIPITNTIISIEAQSNGIYVEVEVSTLASTGVEMEALCGVNAALLCAWDMLKMYEKNEGGQYPWTRIESISILEKRKGFPAKD